MHLRTYTNKIDVEIAIDVVLQSFFDSQKFSISNRLKRVSINKEYIFKYIVVYYYFNILLIDFSYYK